MLGNGAGSLRQEAVEIRADVLCYTTDPLESDLEATGPVRLTLHVNSSASCTDFTGKLVDVFPDGSAWNVTDGIRRVQSVASMQNSPMQVDIDLWPTSMLFKAGHRIRVEVSSSNYPRFDRNPNTGREIATETQPTVATQAIHHGRTAPSRLVLPVVPR